VSTFVRRITNSASIPFSFCKLIILKFLTIFINCLTANYGNLPCSGTAFVRAKVTHPHQPIKTSTMKSFLPLLSSIVLLGSCTTAYKSGQTPDDVYYSPARPQAEYVRVEDKDDRRYRSEDDYYSYESDRYLRYRVRNRSRWSYLDDYYRDPYAYRYDQYRYYSPYYSNYWDYRNSWNYYYNPYVSYYPYGSYYPYIANPKAPVYSRPRTYNLHVFDNPANNSVNPKLPNAKNRSYDNWSNRGSDRNRNAGSDLRRVFGTDNNSTQRNNTYNPPSRASSDNSSSSGSSGSGTKTSSNAPTRKF